MTVFTLPSYPYVFKVIKDVIPHPKETDRQQIMAKYQLVKLHDRVGRMADTWEYSQVTLPRGRCSPELIEELRTYCPSQLEFGDGTLTIRHVYIERRMTPLNLYLAKATDAEVEHAVFEYGNAIKELAAANIFPGDMLYKNFGVTRLNRVVFYDYDEIEYMTDCNFRTLPAPGSMDDDYGGEITSYVDRRDMFPEQWRPFLTGDPRIRAALLKYHADLFDPAFWQRRKERIVAGHLEDVFPYPGERRFSRRFASEFSKESNP
jgi:isocitrate dehydrogenase kinase/phosphatase